MNTKSEVEWLAGGEDYDDGIFSLPDGTLIAKEYESDRYGVKRTFKVLVGGKPQLPHVKEGHLTTAFYEDLHQVIEELKNR